VAGRKTDPEIVNVFAERLNLLRVERGLERSDISHDLRAPYSQIHQWCSGKICPSTTYLIKLADYFDVSIDYLLGQTDTRKRN